MEIKAKFSNSIFRSDSDFCIYEYKCLDKTESELIDEYGYFIATGYMLPENGVSILSGEITKHQKYGFQLSVSAFCEVLPEKKDEILEWLINGKFKKLGKSTAKKLVNKFGADTIRVINEEPDKIIEIMGEKKGNEFLKDFASKKALVNLFPIMNKYDLSPLMAKKTYEKFNQSSNMVELLTNRPYLLCLIDGVSFLKIDNIEKTKENFNPCSKDRISFGIDYVVKENESAGHLFIYPNDLITKIQKTLTGVSADYIKMIINEQVQKGNLVFQNGGIYRKASFLAEDCSAKRLIELMDFTPSFNKRDIESAINENMEINLDEIQRQAIITGLTNSVSVITGGPGRGKTAILKVLVKTAQTLKKNIKISCCAPTGRASKRMEESIGEVQNVTFGTIHSLLGIRPGEEEFAKNVEADLIIIDETSMVDQFLLKILLENIMPKTILIFVGDANQLPSVMAGEVLGELIRSTVIPVTFLEKIYRQDEGNSVFINSQKIEKEDDNLVFDDNFKLINCKTEEQVLEQLDLLLKEELKNEEYQILTPLRKNTLIGCNKLNPFLQERINPHSNGLKYRGTNWLLGDKVINLKNEDEVSNGDVGKITLVKINGDETGIDVKFESNICKEYSKVELEKLELAYALTVHKSQGGEYPIVVIPFISKVGRMRQKRLFYTAITRAKKKVIILGDKDSVNAAIHNKYAEQRRNTFFADRLYTYKMIGINNVA